MTRITKTSCWLAGTMGAVPTLASGGGGGGASLIEPHIGTIFWTLVTFILLVLLLRRFAWKPLLGALEGREKSIRETIDQARRDQEEAQSLLVQHGKMLDEARRERADALANGQRDAEKLKAEILEQAREQREQLIEQTQKQIEAGMRQARAELRGVAADLAIQAAEKLLAQTLDDASQRKLVEEYLADLERSSDNDSLPS